MGVGTGRAFQLFRDSALDLVPGEKLKILVKCSISTDRSVDMKKALLRLVERMRGEGKCERLRWEEGLFILANHSIVGIDKI